MAGRRKAAKTSASRGRSSATESGDSDVTSVEMKDTKDEKDEKGQGRMVAASRERIEQDSKGVLVFVPWDEKKSVLDWISFWFLASDKDSLVEVLENRHRALRVDTARWTLRQWKAELDAWDDDTKDEFVSRVFVAREDILLADVLARDAREGQWLVVGVKFLPYGRATIPEWQSILWTRKRDKGLATYTVASDVKMEVIDYWKLWQSRSTVPLQLVPLVHPIWFTPASHSEIKANVGLNFVEQQSVLPIHPSFHQSRMRWDTLFRGFPLQSGDGPVWTVHEYWHHWKERQSTMSMNLQQALPVLWVQSNAWSTLDLVVLVRHPSTSKVPCWNGNLWRSRTATQVWARMVTGTRFVHPTTGFDWKEFQSTHYSDCLTPEHVSRSIQNPRWRPLLDDDSKLNLTAVLELGGRTGRILTLLAVVWQFWRVDSHSRWLQRLRTGQFENRVFVYLPTYAALRTEQQLANVYAWEPRFLNEKWWPVWASWIILDEHAPNPSLYDFLIDTLNVSNHRFSTTLEWVLAYPNSHPNRLVVDADSWQNASPTMSSDSESKLPSTTRTVTVPDLRRAALAWSRRLLIRAQVAYYHSLQYTLLRRVSKVERDDRSTYTGFLVYAQRRLDKIYLDPLALPIVPSLVQTRAAITLSAPPTLAPVTRHLSSPTPLPLPPLPPSVTPPTAIPFSTKLFGGAHGYQHHSDPIQRQGGLTRTTSKLLMRPDNNKEEQKRIELERQTIQRDSRGILKFINKHDLRTFGEWDRFWMAQPGGLDRWRPADDRKTPQKIPLITFLRWIHAHGPLPDTLQEQWSDDEPHGVAKEVLNRDVILGSSLPDTDDPNYGWWIQRKGTFFWSDGVSSYSWQWLTRHIFGEDNLVHEIFDGIVHSGNEDWVDTPADLDTFRLAYEQAKRKKLFVALLPRHIEWFRPYPRKLQQVPEGLIFMPPTGTWLIEQHPLWVPTELTFAPSLIAGMDDWDKMFFGHSIANEVDRERELKEQDRKYSLYDYVYQLNPNRSPPVDLTQRTLWIVDSKSTSGTDSKEQIVAVIRPLSSSDSSYFGRFCRNPSDLITSDDWPTEPRQLTDNRVVTLYRPTSGDWSQLIKQGGDCFLQKQLVSSFNQAEAVYEWIEGGPNPISDQFYKLPYPGIWIDRLSYELIAAPEAENQKHKSYLMIPWREVSFGSVGGVLGIVSSLHGHTETIYRLFELPHEPWRETWWPVLFRWWWTYSGDPGLSDSAASELIRLMKDQVLVGSRLWQPTIWTTTEELVQLLTRPIRLRDESTIVVRSYPQRILVHLVDLRRRRFPHPKEPESEQDLFAASKWLRQTSNEMQGWFQSYLEYDQLLSYLVAIAYEPDNEREWMREERFNWNDHLVHAYGLARLAWNFQRNYVSL